MVSDGAFLWDFLVCRCVSPHPRLYAFLVLFYLAFKKFVLSYWIFFFGLFALVSCGFGWVARWGRGWGRRNCDQNRGYEKKSTFNF